MTSIRWYLAVLCCAVMFGAGCEDPAADDAADEVERPQHGVVLVQLRQLALGEDRAQLALEALGEPDAGHTHTIVGDQRAAKLEVLTQPLAVGIAERRELRIAADVEQRVAEEHGRSNLHDLRAEPRLHARALDDLPHEPPPGVGAHVPVARVLHLREHDLRLLRHSRGNAGAGQQRAQQQSIHGSQRAPPVSTR